MARSLDDIRKRCGAALQATPAQQAIVFGSWARGTQTRHSDIDMIIIEQTERPFFERYRDFGALFDTCKDQGLDLLVYTPDELAGMKNRSFIKKAFSEGIVIYER
jgi:predicted nucleotidyltransferase